MRKSASCHPDKFVRANGLCNSCYAKDFYKRFPEQREKACERTRRWKAKNLEKVKRLDTEKHLRRKFGITLETYQKMFEDQNGLCKLCRKPETTRVHKNKEQRLAVDHCHKTKNVRGLLCFKCNTALHLIEANPGILDVIANYLRRIE